MAADSDVRAGRDPTPRRGTGDSPEGGLRIIVTKSFVKSTVCTKDFVRPGRNASRDGRGMAKVGRNPIGRNPLGRIRIWWLGLGWRTGPGGPRRSQARRPNSRFRHQIEPRPPKGMVTIASPIDSMIASWKNAASMPLGSRSPVASVEASQATAASR
jgi:hypothetical protein